MPTRKRSTDSTVAPTSSAAKRRELHRRLFTRPHLLFACPERQHQRLAALFVGQSEVTTEAGDGANHRQHAAAAHEP